MEELLAYVKPAIAVLPVSKSEAAIVATAVDARGYGRAAFLFLTGAMGTGAVVTCSVTESATSGGTYAQQSTTAALTDLESTAGLNKMYAIDVPINSSKPYLKLYGTCATAAVLHGAICLLYRGVNNADPNVDTVLSQYVRKI